MWFQEKVSIHKGKYHDYKYYHSSLDNLDYVSPDQINESFQLHIQFLKDFELNRPWKRTEPYGEPQLGKHGLYGNTGGAFLPSATEYSEMELRLWILFLCDGKTTPLEISKICKTPLNRVLDEINKLSSKKIIF